MREREGVTATPPPTLKIAQSTNQLSCAAGSQGHRVTHRMAGGHTPPGSPTSCSWLMTALGEEPGVGGPPLCFGLWPYPVLALVYAHLRPTSLGCTCPLYAGTPPSHLYKLGEGGVLLKQGEVTPGAQRDLEGPPSGQAPRADHLGRKEPETVGRGWQAGRAASEAALRVPCILP